MQTSNHFMLLKFIWLKPVTICVNSYLSVSSLKCLTETDNYPRQINPLANITF